MIRAYDHSGNWVAWKVGRGEKIILWMDPWIGCARNHMMYEPPRNVLNTMIIIRLRDDAREES